MQQQKKIQRTHGYKQEDLNTAAKEVLEDNAKLTDAAKKYKIPQSTLSDNVKKVTTINCAYFNYCLSEKLA